MSDARQRERGSVLAPDVFLRESKAPENVDSPIPAGHEIAALVIVRDDETCTVAWGRGWGVYDRMPGVWPNAQEAMKTVERIAGGKVTWYKTGVDIWEGRL